MPQTALNRSLLAAFILLVPLAGYLGYRTWILTEARSALNARLATTTAEMTAEIGLLAEALESTRTERDYLGERLMAEQKRNDDFAEQIENLTGTVGKLDKLAQTDPELLRKYSKVYFLNEHYAPAGLRLLDDKYAYDESREHYLLKEVLPFFEDMIEDAEDDGVALLVVSAFRSFETQVELKGHYTVTYGSGANAFSADQGYSEHQLGTTVDFTTEGLAGSLTGFETTEAYEWLIENAHKYGFALSYPEGNSYYIFEPWHWRFVGRDLARDLNRKNQHFYDLDQRTLDGYLISVFD